MNKKFLSAILFGALVASTGSFVSCADNDDDIKQLQDQNSELKAQLAALKTELQAELKEAASASQVAAVEAKLSAIESATAENMKATVDALNGKFDTQESKIVAINTQLKALEGLQGVDAKELIAALEKAKENAGADMNVLSAMVDALDEDVNVLKSALRALVFQPEFYMDGIEAAEYTYVKYAKLSSTGDRYIATDVWADWQKVNGEWQWTINGDATTIKNHAGVEVALDKSVEWHYYHKGNIVTPAVGEGTFNQDADNYYVKAMNPTGDYITVPTKNWQGKFNSDATYVYAPSAITTAWATTNTLRFAMNPSNAKVDAAAMSIVTKTIAAMVRGAETKIAIDGCETKGGYLYVKYHFTAESQLISAYSKEADKMNNVEGVILDKQDNTTIVKLNVALDEGSVESDWAAIYETSIQPVALGVVPGSPVMGALDGCAVTSAMKVNEAGIPYYKNNNTGAEILEYEYNALPDWDKPNYAVAYYPTGNTEYWKNPYLALKADPTYGVDYDKSIDLSKLVNVHLLKRDDHKKAEDNTKYEKEDHHTTMTLAEVEAAYGFVAEFIPVKYYTQTGNDGNNTNPTAYVDVTKAGVVTPGHVNADGSFNADRNVASVGMEPLVQVLLKDKDGDVVLDAYILLKITRTIDPIILLEISLGTKAFSCDEVYFNQTWSEFSKLILADPKVNMSPAELDEHYDWAGTYADGYWWLNQYDANQKDVYWGWNMVAEVMLKRDPSENKNHTYLVKIQPAAQEWVYQQPNHEYTTYVKLTANGTAINTGKYADIYVPLKIKIADYAAYALGNKIPEYWYAADGTPTVTPDAAIRFNVDYPKDNGTTKNFVSEIEEAWESNTAKFFNPGQSSWADAEHTDWIKQDHKYYFHPATNNVQVVNEYNGKTYYLWVANADPFAGEVVEMTKANNDAKNAAIANGNFIGYRTWALGVGPYDSKYYGLTDPDDANKPGKFVNVSAQEDPIKYTQDLESQYKLDVTAGMYKNVVLMATEGVYNADHADWAHSAIVAQLTDNGKKGEITYANNEIAKNVLNAITHATATQKAYIGVNKILCDTYADNVADNVFPVYFLRPIDIVATDTDNKEDAVANGDFVNVYEKFSFIDFRDVPFGYGQDVKNIWLAGYYNIHEVAVDFANAMTTLGSKEGEAAKWSKLGDVSTKVLLSYVQGNKKTVVADNNKDTAEPYYGSIDKTMTSYAKASMGVQSTLDELQKHFGYIKYENNGTNVADFYVTFPVYVTYEWGTVKTEFTVKFKGTMANSGNN